MILMSVVETELTPFADYRDIILYMKNIGLIKDKSRSREFHNIIGEICE